MIKKAVMKKRGNQYQQSMNRNKVNIYFIGGASFCFLFLQWFHLFSLALEPGRRKSDYIHSVWQIEDGLPQNYIGEILQSRDGYIWLGTQEGIVRFDGVKFVTFNNDNTPEIKKNNITALLEGQEGSLWIGTAGGGLLRYKDGNFTNCSAKIPEPNDVITSICASRDGSILFNTLKGELIRLKNGNFTTLNPKGIITKYIVQSLYEDQKGNLWIGTLDKGLVRFIQGIFSVYNTTHGLSGSTVNSICEDREGNLWIGTDGGLNRLKDGKFKTFTIKDGFSRNCVYSIYQDKSGDLWIGTSGGLDRWKDGKFVNYMTENSRFNEMVISIAEDREGNLWVGTMGGGMFQLKHSIFKTYTTRDGLPGGMVCPILGDRSRTLWFGIWSTGIIRMKNNQFKIYTMDDGLSCKFVSTIDEDQKGNLWIGTRGGGLNRFKNNGFTVYTTKNGLSSDHIISMCGSRDGGLWVGTIQGLDKFKDGEVTNYTTKHGLPYKSVSAIYEDSEGKVWIALNRGGLARFEQDIFKTVDLKSLLSDHHIFTIYEDKEKNLWFGTDGRGLLRFKDGKFKVYTTKEGLFDNKIFQILEDEKENLWMGCNRGIFRVNKQEINEFDEGKRYRIRCISYGKEDGMENCECVGGVQPAGWKTPDGKLWFPTMKGLLMIDPNKINTNSIIPPVIIEKIKIDDQVLDPIPDMEISPGTRRFEFQYTALSFVAPRKIKFKYQLEGFDQGWINAGSYMDRSATYTNIPPGSYCFRVIACNNDGIWNETGASFYFKLNPFLYQTHWFYGICILCILAIVIGIHLLRVRQILSKERKKYKKVRLSPECTEQYLNKLLHLMESEKLYLDSDICLDDLSKRLKIQEPYISQVLNMRLKQNFYDFINHYRIEEARRIFTDSKNHLTILEVAFRVGFNSKSTFNRAFSKHTQMTPSDFKKKQRSLKIEK